MMKALLVVDVSERNKKLSEAIVHYIKTEHYESLFFTRFRNLRKSNFVKQLSYNKEMNHPRMLQIFAPYITQYNYFIKHTYSALKQPELRNALESFNQLDLCGADTDACILATAYDAFDQNFAVNVLFDLCETKNLQLQTSVRLILQRNIKKN